MCLKQKCVATFVTNNTVKITLVTLKDNKVNITLLRDCLKSLTKIPKDKQKPGTNVI